MESNGRTMETEAQPTQDAAQPVENVNDDDELEIIDDGSNPYKKVKVNVKGESKKKATGEADKASERVDSELGEEDSEAMRNLVQDIRKKKKKSKKKERSGEDAEEPREKEKKKKSEKKEGSKKKKDTEASGEKEGEEKEKKKKKKKKEKEEDGEKEKKKKKKKKEGHGEDEDAKDKEKKKQKKKEKALEAYQKKFHEFEKKYPQYIQKGKIKFPIEDVLFKLYDTILNEHLPKTKKPTPKNGLIPSGELGDILQIWNYYESFPDLFTFRDVLQEEIYACLKYEGDEHLHLIDSLHQEILIFFVKDFIKKNKFETFKDEVENPFFVLVKYYAGYEGPQSSELLLIWTELLRRLSNIQPFTEQLSLTSKKYIENLSESSALNYNKVEYKMKIRALIELINLSYESETFRDCLQEKMDQATGLGREKNELLQEIKQEEQEYYDLKAKVEVSEKAQKEEEEKWEQLSRTEVLKRQKDFENEKKEYQKTLAALAKVEASLQRKRKRVEEIISSTNVTIDTATRLGVDGNKSEYWIFTNHPERLYVKISPLVTTEETWCYFDQQEDVDQLLEALNTKGIKEKHLYDKIREAVSNKHLDLKSSKSEEAKTEEKKDETDINFWYAKVLEFTPASDLPDELAEQVRTTRHRAQEHTAEKNHKKRPRDLKYLTLDGVKEILDTVEGHLTEYLAKWNARWAHPRIKEELKRKIKEATTVKELAGLLLELEKNFQYSETPLRQKTMEEAAANPDEPEQDDYEDRSEDDEGEESGEEDIEGEEHYYGDNKENRRKAKRKGTGDDEEEDEQNEEEENDEENGEDEQRKMEDENKEDIKSENKMETEESHEKKEEGKENGVAGEIQPLEKVKKMSLKIWGRINERIRRCWVAFMKDVDNVTGLFLCASIFSEFVENYLEKKRIKYFTEFDNIAQYMAAKRERKQNVAADRAISNKKENRNSLEKLRRDREIRRQNYNLTKYATQHTRQDRERDRDREEQLSDSQERPIKKKAGFNREPPAETHSHVKAESGPKRIRKLRDQSSDHSESEAEYEYNPKNEDRPKTKQEKLNELANVRRSTRVTRRTRMSEEEEEETEYQEEKDCAVCRRPSGELVVCAMCDSAYHLDCIGLKKMPEDKWTCFSCLQKLVGQRQTRSTTRKLH